MQFSGFSTYSSGLVALRPDFNSPARGGIPVRCMGRQILHHWTTGGALPHPLLSFSMRPRCGWPSALTPSRPPALPPLRLCQALVQATGQSEGSSPWKTWPSSVGTGNGAVGRGISPDRDTEVCQEKRKSTKYLWIFCVTSSLYFPQRYLQTPAAEDKSSPEETPVRKLHQLISTVLPTLSV